MSGAWFPAEGRVPEPNLNPPVLGPVQHGCLGQPFHPGVPQSEGQGQSPIPFSQGLPRGYSHVAPFEVSPQHLGRDEAIAQGSPDGGFPPSQEAWNLMAD